jgi:hypothetical protein
MTFEAAWEAFLERRAIMEFDGGLSRRAAVLKAFEWYFPGDFRECMKTAWQGEAGETMLYEYLDGFIKASKTHEEGPILHPGSIGREIIRQDVNRPPTGRETGFKTIRQGIPALEYMTEHGIPLMGVYPSGAMIAKQEPENFTADRAEIAALMAGAGDKEGRA